jgi:hypothetical protein
MKFRLLLSLIACVVTAPALAWSGSAQAGDYRVTAILADNNARLQSISVASNMRVSSGNMQLRAWFVDSEGGILASAPLSVPDAAGTTLVALGKGVGIPSDATALVVLAQPAGLTRASTATAPAIVAQIALP